MAKKNFDGKFPTHVVGGKLIEISTALKLTRNSSPNFGRIIQLTFPPTYLPLGKNNLYYFPSYSFNICFNSLQNDSFTYYVTQKRGKGTYYEDLEDLLRFILTFFIPRTNFVTEGRGVKTAIFASRNK